MITILGGGIAGVTLAKALAVRGRRDVVVFDQHPLVGETSRVGVWACCGFSGHGMIQAPAVAESLAAMILGQTPPLDISAFSPQRTEPLVEITQV